MISVAELELLGFFETEPRTRDAGAAWPDNDFLYEIARGDLQLSCALAPAYKDVRLILKRGADTLYELNALGVDDVRYHNQAGREVLEIVLSRRERLWLRVKPAIAITQEVTGAS